MNDILVDLMKFSKNHKEVSENIKTVIDIYSRDLITDFELEVFLDCLEICELTEPTKLVDICNDLVSEFKLKLHGGS